MKKYIIRCCRILIISLALALTSCKSQTPDYVNDLVKEYLEKQNIFNSKIDKVGNFKNIQFTKLSSQIDEVEIEEETEQRITEELDAATTYEKIKNRKKVKKGDFVNISYTVFNNNGKKVNEVSDQMLKVGAGYYDKQLESVIIGKEVEKTYYEELVVPDTVSNVSLIGKKEKFEITINAIMRCCEKELNQAFVEEYTAYDSVAEYKQAIRNQIVQEKKEKNIIEQKDNIIYQLLQNSEFSIDENEVIDAAVTVVKSEKQVAKLNNLSYDEYIEQIYGISKDEYYDKLYKEMEQQIEVALLIGALANELNVTCEFDEDNMENSYSVLYDNVCKELIKEIGDE